MTLLFLNTYINIFGTNWCPPAWMHLAPATFPFDTLMSNRSSHGCQVTHHTTSHATLHCTELHWTTRHCSAHGCKAVHTRADPDDGCGGGLIPACLSSPYILGHISILASTVTYSTVVQYTLLQYSTLCFSTVHSASVLYSTLYFSTAWCAVHCNVQQDRTVRYRAMYNSTV